MSVLKSEYKVPAVLIALIAVLVLVGSAGFPAPQERNTQQIVVHLKHASDDLHAAFMALKLAGGLQAKGAEVTLFVNLEGARLADARLPKDLRWGPGGMPLSHHYDAFIAAGGQVLVCPHCAAAAGLDPEKLREGARIGTDDDVIAMLLEADKILDY